MLCGSIQVSRGEGVKRSKQIGAVKFVECSAKSGEKLDEVIVECVRAGIGKSTARKNRCIFLWLPCPALHDPPV